jgi:acetyl-CoA acetyltransferase
MTLPLFRSGALLARNPSLAGDAIDEVLLGCANQAGEDNRNVARMAAFWRDCRSRCRG